MPDDLYHEYRRYISDHPGHPLGPGMPLGRSLRIEVFHEHTQMWRGESHLMWWERVIRDDPCSFCGAYWSGTVDHIEPKSLPIRGLGGANSWTNVAAACSACNGSKARRSLLQHLLVRCPGKRPDKRRENTL